MAIESKDIAKLQSNLSSIRKIAGWTAQDLGKKIGVTKQTISNLENQKTEMTVTQYIAIRTVLDYEIANNSENELLAQVVPLLLDVPRENLSEDDYNKVNQVVTTMAAAAAGGMALSSLVTISAGLFGGIAGLTAIGAATRTTSWLKKMMENK